jgi:hypothetical protein
MEIETTRDEISEAELLEIAREVGIHPDAVRAALTEHNAGVLPDATARDGAPDGWFSALLASGAAFTLLGIVTRTIRPFVDGMVHWESLAGFAAIVAVLALLAWRPARHRRQLMYQLYNVVVWAGYATGWALVHGSLWDDLTEVTVLGWAGAAVLGGIITARRKPPASHARVGAANVWAQAVRRFGGLVRGKLAPGSRNSQHAVLRPSVA